MAKFQFEIDADADIESIASSFALFSSAVLDARSPDNDQRWAREMAVIVRVINEHVRSAQETSED